ncbi:MAG: isoleucine--tRNA ligase [Candidatus Wildermuthbacteria bacterium]|nr:isoleucine--tRNA ligase [Candidatus Wildermuthbacteria bacterium]
MDVNFPKLEEEVLERWKKERTFEKSVEKRKKGKRFVFYEGPPTANAGPGIHHVLSRVFKDIILRYKTMAGFLVERRAGWDTHGLPVELQIEKKLGLKSKKDIEKYGIAKFNAECKKSVWEFKKEWEGLTERIGFWLDMKNPYVTYETSYIETLWFIIKTFWKKKLLYKDHKVVPYCSRCGTPLSSHEMAQGYRTITEPSVIVKFQIRNPKSEIPISSRILDGVGTHPKSQISKSKTYFLAWTTTPWTLPGNVALAVGKDIEYVLAEKEGDTYILAEDLAEKVLGDHKIIKTFKGKDLIGTAYEPLFRFGKAQAGKKIWQVVPAGFVSIKEGTGIVHTAVAYGEDDFNLGKKENLAMLQLVDEQGKFIASVMPWKGMFVKDADPLIVENLKKRGLLFKEELYEHEYPFCWRCSTPLLYYAKESWFVNVQKVKRQLIKNNDAINWIPSHIKKGRMGEWLKEAKDWAFSRERYWGTPLPIWECKKCEHREVMGSVQELRANAHAVSRNEQGEIDLHRPYVDEVKFPCARCKNGTMERVKEVADVWFDSGSMPFAQNHWMGGQLREFPADYIVEGIDQTRGWFYTLLAVSTLLGFKAPYKNVITLSHVLDEKGEKMSKSKGNVVSPWDMIAKYGVDAVRWYFFTINNPGDPKLFSEKDIQQATRNFLLTFWNCFVFYKTYNPQSVIRNSKLRITNNALGKWILSRLAGTVEGVTKKLDAYDVTGAGRAIQDFVVNDLSLWYIRRSRGRAKEASATLRFVLSEVCKVAAPFTPFLAEYIYKELGNKDLSDRQAGSVHLTSWPKPKAQNTKLETQMVWVRDIVAKALAERAKAGIKVRQPLALLKIRNPKPETRNELLLLIKDEVNVKELAFDKDLKQDVELDTRITPELKKEGMLRELVRNIQDLRKEVGYKPGEKAVLYYEGSGELADIFQRNKSLIAKGTSIQKFVAGKTQDPDKGKDIAIENSSLWLGIKK